MYDGGEHTPKLLQCSHTVCLHCLTRIAASPSRDTGSFRCPICRELIVIPRGGVAALPPSFLVNQLLDLMSRQRREVIPKCSVHINQELLFCETCDTVFCTLCTGGSHSDSANSGEHTIIPFSIAIKRMSEILLYKANECISKVSSWDIIWFNDNLSWWLKINIPVYIQLWYWCVPVLSLLYYVCMLWSWKVTIYLADLIGFAVLIECSNTYILLDGLTLIFLKYKCSKSYDMYLRRIENLKTHTQERFGLYNIYIVCCI